MAKSWMPVFSVVRAQHTHYASHPDSKEAYPPNTDQHRQHGRDRWQRIGTAHANADGSYTIILRAIPLDGTLTMRPPQLHEREDMTEEE